MAEDFDKSADFGADLGKSADFAAADDKSADFADDDNKSADFADDSDKSADFGADFAKSADFIVAGSRTLMELLLELERTPADQLRGALPEIRKRAQRTRHRLETVGAGVPRLVNGIRQGMRSGGQAGNGVHETHVHLHLHLSASDGNVSLRTK